MTEIPSAGQAGRPGSQDPAGMAGGVLRSLPKISLHDHLDGGMRPQTLLELSAAAGREVPADTADGLAAWIRGAADSGSLERYLQTFQHALAVLQDAGALRRTAREAVEDLADDGVIHAELRWAPEQHLSGGLSLGEAVDAVQEGLREGIAAAAGQGREISAGQLLCAMRQGARSPEIARLVVERFAPDEPGGVLGFDLAGPEDGFPPSAHREALDLLAQHLVPVTLHAGEGSGLGSLRSAVVDGRALRLGHGVRIVEDIELSDAPDDDVSIELGELARWVRDRGIALEVCPRSNAQTGAVAAWRPPGNLVRVLGPGTDRHPVGFLHRAGFRVVIGPDNRLVSGSDITTELGDLITLHGFTLDDVEALQRSGAQAAFLPLDRRLALEARIGAQFDAVRQSGIPLGLGDLMAAAPTAGQQ
ncbi:adenosine deaminase [Kocuria palustris]|uniref:adenosine deaminase n=1 Tax=Kocuria palustris TaxID=71999 RepID=UPI0011A5D4C1|nr:adenosine deaminase [Kocuria palustris]